MEHGKIVKISGPLVEAENMKQANLFDVVRVGPMGLVGEIIEMREDRASIQVYEETAGLKTGDPAVSTGEPLSAELGPGILEMIFDGIQRPLEVMKAKTGSSIARGVEVTALDHSRLWEFCPVLKKGDRAAAGDVIGTVQETRRILHKIMIPPGISGTIEEISSGMYKITDSVAKIRMGNGQIQNVAMMQKWPVRKQRPFQKS